VESKELKTADIGSSKLSYRLFGENKRSIIVIENALASCSAEWWHLAEVLSENAIVLTYDRAGYGKSTLSKLTRTPKNVAKELYDLLETLNLVDNITLVGHSQGGLYAQQFVRDYPNRVKTLILIDPLSANDSCFSALLTKEEFAQSGVDKTKALKIGVLACSIGLGLVLKPLLKKGVPFYYYNNFSKAAEDYILSSLTKAKHYKTALEEYRLAHVEDQIRELKEKNAFPDIPLTLITHSSKVLVEEIIYYGGAINEVAQKVEQIWQDIMKEYLSFSKMSKWIQAEKSGHFIHLSESKLVIDSICEILK
jgi:pimeloyl-ACP methyl ester carboxylesterase